MNLSNSEIIHIIPSLTSYSWGPTSSVISLVDHISKYSKIKIYTLKWNKELIRPDITNYFKISFPPKKLGFSNELYFKLKLNIQSGKVSLIHNHSLWMMPNVYPGLIANTNSIPYIVTPHGVFSEWALKRNKILKILFWNVFQKRSLHSVSAFIATSEQECLDIRAFGLKQPIALIPLGIEITNELPKYEKAKIKTIIFLGRIHPVKGIEDLLFAWKIIEKEFPDWILRIAGPCEDDYYDKIKKLSANLQLKKIEFLEELRDKDKEEFFLSSDLFILPSHTENFGLAIAEALSFGIPVITTVKTPWKDLLYYKAGWYIKDDELSIIYCLREVLQKEREELQKIGKNGRELIRQKYSTKINAEKTLILYNWIINKTSKPDFIYD